MKDKQPVGYPVRCTVCGRDKAPVGRSVSPVAAPGLCTMMGGCEGYRLSPHPGDLWPGETAEEFGYPCSGPDEGDEDA